MAEFRMPSLGADMDEGVLVEWLVHPGDTVRKGQIVAVVDTAKANIEVECFTTGVVRELLVPERTRVPVGTVLATIDTDEPAPALAPVPAASPTPIASPLVRRLAAQRHVDLHTLAGTGMGGRITHHDVEEATPTTRQRVSPLARRLAAELGVDLATLHGTGSAGAISADDVRTAAKPVQLHTVRPDTAQTEDRTAAMRQAIATLMARSKREIPHYYVSETVDLGTAVDWLHERNRRLPVPQRLVAAALLLKAAALAARAVPQLNGFWIDDAFVAAPAVHLGVAVSLRGGGLVAPAIHDADTLDLPTLMARMRDLVTRTRAGRLRGTEMRDPTITVSNMGEQGSEAIFGVIYPPQVALVGFGRIAERPWTVGGLIGVRPLVTVSLAADHRATDGATGARYLNHIATLLSRPEEL
jgi:pyruvate/2-oxoglutarate dehydrogenase complex dihydrolipoamide acyltransferase (E2) component